MGVADRLLFALHAAGAWLGVDPPPADDAGRLAEIEALYAGYRVEFPGAPEVRVAEVRGASDVTFADVVFVDVRTDRERAVSTLPGAVTGDAVLADPAAYAGRRLVAYCTIGYRSGQWVEAHPELGAANLVGGVLAWSHAGGPFVDGAGAAFDGPPRVHVYGRPWDLLPASAVAVW